MNKKDITLPSAEALPHLFLILDTGGWTIKHGLFVIGENNSIHIKPNVTPNATAQLPHQITTWVGKDMESSVKYQSLLKVSRPMDRGYYSDFQTQVLVWEHVLDSSYGGRASPSTIEEFQQGQSIPFALHHHHEWAIKDISTMAHSNKVLSKTAVPPNTCTKTSNNMKIIPTHGSTVVLLCKPLVPTCLLEHEDEIWFRNFGFGTIIRRLSACCSAFKYLGQVRSSVHVNGGIPDNDETACCCVVESGFSLTHIVPTVQTWALVCIKYSCSLFFYELFH